MNAAFLSGGLSLDTPSYYNPAASQTRFYNQDFIGPVRPTDSYIPKRNGSVLGDNVGFNTTNPSPTPTNNKTTGSVNAPSVPTNNVDLSQFDRNLADLQGQLGAYGRDQENAINQINTAQQGLLSQVDQQKSAVNQNREDSIYQASETARNTQKANRNVLRALGILNSTYGADKLSEPLNNFDKVRGGIVQQATDRINQLDDFANQKRSEFVNAVSSLKSQYQTAVENIQRDITFTNRERADAVAAANAAYQNKLSELKGTSQRLIDQANQMKQNFIATNFQQLLSANPDLSANIGQINQSLIGLQGAADQIYGTSQQAAIEQQKKKPVDLNSAFLSGGLTLNSLGSGY